ncbi:MAG TPA: 50S ribosomal protein L11 methyltransferase [Pseudomonadales bacterium]
MTVAALNRQLNRTLPDARMEVVTLPDCGGLRLALISADYQTGPLDPDVMQAVIREPAYWSFCWGSGLALARFLLQHPHRVRNRTVLDLGAGSGVAGIAAALAGARRVIACDTDPDALLATRTNAELNGVSVSLTDRLSAATAPQPGKADLLLMADVLYDRRNLPLLETAQRHATEILVADSRVTTLPDPSYREIASIDARTLPNLGEFDEFRTAHLFEWRQTPPGRDTPVSRI